MQNNESAILKASNLLSGMGLSQDDVMALVNQGFVAAEFRAYHGKQLGPYYKLRWRMNGRQRVKYLGHDAQQAGEICNAIDNLRNEKLVDNQLARSVAKARQSLRKAKKEMAALMAGRGEYYHGYSSRKRRNGSDRGSEVEL